MFSKKTTPERLAAFSDGVFSVIITIMVLDLKPSAEATLKALLPAVAHCQCFRAAEKYANDCGVYV